MKMNLRLLVAAAAMTTVLSGCATQKLTPPATDFVSTVPEAYEVELLKLNNEPSQAFPGGGGNMTFQYTPENALLTVVFQLQNSRRFWDFDRRTVEKDLFPRACENFADPLAAGMGLRYWYAGHGGYVTQVLTDEKCQAILNKS